MPIVYWRHANDNESSPAKKHDPRATGKGRHNAKKMARRMARKRGAPDVIYVSPMRRCRDTVRSMIEGLEKDNWPAPRLVVDENLSRYFCSREQKRPRVRKSTGEVPIVETWSQFRGRVRKRADFLWQTHGPSDGEVAWCVTHALVIKQLAMYHSVKIPGWLDFLFNFVPNTVAPPPGTASHRPKSRPQGPKARSPKKRDLKKDRPTRAKTKRGDRKRRLCKGKPSKKCELVPVR